MRESADPVVVDVPSPPVRLRFVLLVAAFGLAASLLYPRMGAAFRLNSAASAFADYALCMVGPTGPSLLRDNPSEFRKLVRRRLVAAPAEDRPFARCAKGARLVTQSVSVERAHLAVARSFVEYGLGPSLTTAPVRLDELAVTTRPLSELTDAAWPFVRGGYTSLIVASAYASEAAHPSEFPRAGLAKGPTPGRTLATCVASGESAPRYAVGLAPDRKTTIVRSLSPEGITSDATLGPAEARIAAVSCDDKTLVAAVGRPATRSVSFYSCSHLGSCQPMPVPRFGKDGAEADFPLDLARIDGVTVVAVARAGITRVASSRDDGRTWTPFTVAFDAESHRDVVRDGLVPDRLFVSGKRILLYAEPRRPGGTFPILASDDAGASFHAP
ncbi:MAG TPA: hypothetical protein VHE30_24385 [Polyangiaceae bacterium]|nr:hypothetical protein [Polyangiaceae bacterium]